MSFITVEYNEEREKQGVEKSSQCWPLHWPVERGWRPPWALSGRQVGATSVNHYLKMPVTQDKVLATRKTSKTKEGRLPMLAA